MKEWSDPLNPFNSMKVLMYSKHLKACSTDVYLAPVTIAVDPSNICNYNCIWCNAYDVISRQQMTKEHMFEIADLCKEWGIISTCVAGGGEPLTNPHTGSFLVKLHENGIKNSIITNGYFLNEAISSIVSRTCRWIGLSMDAGMNETYKKVKGIDFDCFGKICDQVYQLRKIIDKTNSECRIGYKFLIHPDNQGEIYQAVKLAKSVGFHDFQARPVGWQNLTKTNGTPDLVYDHDLIKKQIDESIELEDDNFKIHMVIHKFNSDFTGKKKFKRCYAIPLHPTFSADGNVYICFDMRGNKDKILCRHGEDVREILTVWNTEKHRDMIRNIDINKCPRCTFSGYNEIVEKVFIDDRMCRDFV